MLSYGDMTSSGTDVWNCPLLPREERLVSFSNTPVPGIGLLCQIHPPADQGHLANQGMRVDDGAKSHRVVWLEGSEAWHLLVVWRVDS